MSRSNYSDECEYLGLYRASVDRAIAGRRGQSALRETLEALDAMPVKELVAESLVTSAGEFCTLGALGHKRGLDMSNLDPNEPHDVAKAFRIAQSLASEIVYENDEVGPSDETPGQRWTRMRAWVVAHLSVTP